MNQPKAAHCFRILALCTALGLGGTYVWRQQQKAAPHVEEPEKVVERTVLSGSKSAVISTGILPTVEETNDRVLMPESKSDSFGIIWENRERTLMPSSKSGIVQPKFEIEVTPKLRTVLPGSKSFIFDQLVLPVDEKKATLPELQQEPGVVKPIQTPRSKNDFVSPIFEESKQRTLLPGSKNPARILDPKKIDPLLPSPEIPVAPKQRTLLPGSKSIDAILRPKDLATPSKKPPAEP